MYRAQRASGRELVDLTASNTTRAGFEYPPDLLRLLADPCALTYEPAPFGSADARRAIARGPDAPDRDSESG